MKILKYNELINENNTTNNLYREWKYGFIDGELLYNENDINKWLNQYGDFDKSEQIIEKLTDIKYPIAVINRIEVKKEFREHKYGNIILEQFIDNCIDKNVKYIILVADTEEKQKDGFDLVQWYIKKGFYIIDYIYDNPVMKMEI